MQQADSDPLLLEFPSKRAKMGKMKSDKDRRDHYHEGTKYPHHHHHQYHHHASGAGASSSGRSPPAIDSSLLSDLPDITTTNDDGDDDFPILEFNDQDVEVIVLDD